MLTGAVVHQLYTLQDVAGVSNCSPSVAGDCIDPQNLVHVHITHQYNYSSTTVAQTQYNVPIRGIGRRSCLATGDDTLQSIHTHSTHD